jgi:hypothetical protein
MTRARVFSSPGDLRVTLDRFGVGANVCASSHISAMSLTRRAVLHDDHQSSRTHACYELEFFVTRFRYLFELLMYPHSAGHGA